MRELKIERKIIPTIDEQEKNARTDPQRLRVCAGILVFGFTRYSMKALK